MCWNIMKLWTKNKQTILCREICLIEKCTLRNIAIKVYCKVCTIESAHVIMVLFVLRKLILQTRMHRHPVGLENWFFGRTLRLLPYFMCANSEGSGEIAWMYRLALIFSGRLCDKYHNLMSWLKYVCILDHIVVFISSSYNCMLLVKAMYSLYETSTKGGCTCYWASGPAHGPKGLLHCQ